MKPRSRTRPATRQTGYALLLMVLALMGIGGLVVTGFIQNAKQETEHQRFLHNERVLKEAKLALLQYAYNYPQLGPGQDDGPGRLPCPDTDNDGLEDFEVGCVDTVPDPDVPMVGRLPWRDPRLNFHEAKDVSGERLWYAVSDNFARGLGSFVNSDTVGSITIQDRSGAVLYDGTVNGVAAVIIAPGAPIDRNGVVQDRSIANGNLPFDTLADTDPGIINADRYLDLFGAIDNADFVNGTVNGFVTGPIDNRVNGVLQVNDQMIVITTAEVVAMAEKATLQAYRDSIIAYLDNVAVCTGEFPPNTGATEALCLANDGLWHHYPWLYNYRGVSNIAELSSYYPAFTNFDDERDPDPDPDPDTGYLDNYGRIPSIFANYFTETDSQPIETWFSGSLSLTGVDPGGASDTVTLSAETYCYDSCPGTGGDRVFERGPDAEGPALDIRFGQPLTGVRFVDIDPNNIGNDVRVRATFPAPVSIDIDLYFSGDHRDASTDWTPCPGGADELTDCAFGNNRSILRLYGTLDFNGGDEDFDFDNTIPPTIARWRADGTSHAWITGTYPGDAIISFPGVFATASLPKVLGSLDYEYSDLHPGEELAGSLNATHDDYARGTVDMTGFSLASLTLGMRYFPELPNWAFQNDWHNSIRMAYADVYLPSVPPDPVAGEPDVCVPLPDGDNTNDCLTLPDERGTPRNIASILVIAGQHDWVDDNADAPVIVGLEDELRDVFDNGNQNTNRSFSSVRGNDRILVIEEL